MAALGSSCVGACVIDSVCEPGKEDPCTVIVTPPQQHILRTPVGDDSQEQAGTKGCPPFVAASGARVPVILKRRRADSPSKPAFPSEGGRVDEGRKLSQKGTTSTPQKDLNGTTETQNTGAFKHRPLKLPWFRDPPRITVPTPKMGPNQSTVSSNLNGTQATGGSRGTKTLHLFSGPKDRPDSLTAALRTRGLTSTDFDLTDGFDLRDDLVYTKLTADIKEGVYNFIVAGPPCNTFSRVRSHPGGPPPLRSSEHPYGLPKLNFKYKETLREHNLLALRTSQLCSLVHSYGGGFAIENPAHVSQTDPSIWILDEFKALSKLSRTSFVALDQCRFGGRTTKPTWFLYSGIDLGDLARRCNHPYVNRWTDEGEKYRAPHVRVQCAWDVTAAGGWVRRSQPLSAYPAELNEAIADAISRITTEGAPPTETSNLGRSTKEPWQ